MEHIIEHIFMHTIIDTLKIIPFLFIAFLIMEYLEHKLSTKTTETIKKSGKFGPVIGGLLGSFPQCGFSVMATNLFSAKIITVGTLIAVYLSTSDEMLPILLSNKVEISLIIKIIGLKILIATIVGFIIDLFYKRKNISQNNFKEYCHETHCNCGHNIFKSSLKHTLNITFFIFIVTLIMTGIIEIIGEDSLSNLFTNSTFLGPVIASIIGLIPNCASSVIVTELYLTGAITIGSMIAGLLTGSGVALLVLFKVNKNKKENIAIVSFLYVFGVLSGIILNLLNISL